MILASRFHIKQILQAYGEDELASKIDNVSDTDLNTIGRFAANYIGRGGYVDKCIVLGAIEFLEGFYREPKRKKRILSVYDTKEPEPIENIIARSRIKS